MFDILLLTSVTGELEEHGGKYKTKRNSHLICHRLLNSYLNFGTDVPYSLFQSLDFAENAATAGLPLNDWVGMFYDICRVSVAWNAIEVFFNHVVMICLSHSGSQVASDTWVSFADKMFQTVTRRMRHIQMWWKDGSRFNLKFFAIYLKVRQA
jgi:hypothetical protein